VSIKVAAGATAGGAAAGASTPSGQAAPDGAGDSPSLDSVGGSPRIVYKMEND
jgi:hypothetical protein